MKPIPRLQRLLEDIENLGKIGYREGQGIYRTAFSPDDMRARRFALDIMEEAGLAARIDEAGNVFGRLEGRDAGAPILLVGSHLDTVPGGGRLDGALGVLTAIECCRAIKEAGLHPGRSIEVVGFSDEEGTVTGGTFGCRAMLGRLSDDERGQLADEASEIHLALMAAGLDPRKVARAERNHRDFAGYLELHVEQGGVLEDLSIPVGLVTGIVGIRRYQARIPGKANHAGTTPMHLRDDALVKASRFAVKANEIGLQAGGEAVVTLGWAQVKPGAYNIIPGEVTLGVETRSMSLPLLEEIEGRLIAELRNMGGILEPATTDHPVSLDEGMRGVLRRAAEEEALGYLEMASGAGHDAADISRFIPTAMVFVQSIGGVSHCYEEWTEPGHMEAGMRVLLRAMVHLTA